DLERSVDFEIKGEDVIVFLHIQKTGGTTFGRHWSAERTAGGAVRLPPRPEEVHLLPAEPKGDVALLALLHGLELRAARGLDRAHQLCAGGPQQEGEQEQEAEVGCCSSPEVAGGVAGGVQQALMVFGVCPGGLISRCRGLEWLNSIASQPSHRELRSCVRVPFRPGPKRPVGYGAGLMEIGHFMDGYVQSGWVDRDGLGLAGMGRKCESQLQRPNALAEHISQVLARELLCQESVLLLAACIMSVPETAGQGRPRRIWNW
ncbi:hypothetical protein NFI96_009389, partial [Prochilodus magdalenae]